MELRQHKGMIIKDTRKFFAFTTVHGRLVETKAMNRVEAKKHIEDCLKTKLRKVA